MMTPQVSVVVPCFNEETAIVKQSLESLRLQTFRDFECIVIDESTDEKKAEACRSFCETDDRFVYIHPETRLGLAESLNYGFKQARGKYIARFDSDDICHPSRFEKQVAFLDQNQHIGIVGGSMQIINSEGKVLAFRSYPCEHNAIERKFVYANSLAHPAVMIRKDVIRDEEGPYRKDFRFSEDLELWLRLLSKGVKFANLPDLLVDYRQDSTFRPPANWRFNAMARRIHMSAPYRFQKVLIASLLTIWAGLPKIIQELVYKKLIFNRDE